MTVSVSDGRRQWLSELYKANSAAVFNQCRRLLKSPEDAADATQEIFLRAATSLSEDVVGANARAWLNTVARNYCIDLIRRRERLGSALTTLAGTADAPAQSIESVEDRQMLLEILPQLGPRERQALWQSAVEDLPLTEIARTFGISYLAAAQLLHRARRRALVLATRLAVILSLFRLGGAARRSRWLQRSQQLAALVVVPAAIGLAVVSSAAPPPVIRAHGQSPAPAAVASTGNQASPATGTLPPTSPPPSSAKTAAPIVALAPRAVITAVKPAPTVIPASTLKPTPAPAPADRDKDHGKGRDRDDLAHKHPKGGTASAQAK